MKYLLHFIVFIMLTILTQIGGMVYLIALLSSRNKSKKIKFAFFIVLYLISTFVIVPNIAPLFGRERITENKHIEAHTFMTKLFNRNYVRPELNKVLQKTASQFTAKYKNIKLVYLDANFPFINRFPLVPHLSHHDGRKIDLAFIYQSDGKLTNLKPTVSGYGFFNGAHSNEISQTSICKKKGYKQYDYSKYFTLGTLRRNLKLAEKPTKKLVEIILAQPKIQKIFIEPHLVKRLGLHHSKIRFQGCRSVRHDDHVHIQIY